MSKREPISKIWHDNPNHISKLIFNEMDVYAQDKGFYPVQFALYKYMAEPQWNKATLKMDPARYKGLTQGKFDHWYDRLVEENYIIVDPTTRSVRLMHLVIVEREGIDIA